MLRLHFDTCDDDVANVAFKTVSWLRAHPFCALRIRGFSACAVHNAVSSEHCVGRTNNTLHMIMSLLQNANRRKNDSPWTHKSEIVCRTQCVVVSCSGKVLNACNIDSLTAG